jgi:hypothetical protein
MSNARQRCWETMRAREPSPEVMMLIPRCTDRTFHDAVRGRSRVTIELRVTAGAGPIWTPRVYPDLSPPKGDTRRGP